MSNPTLLVNEAGSIRAEQIVKDITFIGRNEDTDITLNFEGISPFHCQIKRVGEQLRVMNLGAEGGTLVNGISVHEQVLRDEDVIQVGDISIVFRANGEQAAAGGAAPGEEDDFSIFDDLGSGVEFNEDGYFDFGALQREQMRNFLNLNMPINTSPDLNMLLDRVIDSALSLTSSTSGIIIVRDENFRLLPRCQRNLPKETLANAIQTILRPVARRVVETHGVVNIPDIDTETMFRLGDETYPEYQTIVGVPLKAMVKDSGLLSQDMANLHPANRTLGVLILIRHKGNPAYSDKEMTLIEAVSHQVAVSIFNLKLHLMASADDLTGLYNRNYFQRGLTDEVNFARVGRLKLATAILDIDNFKKFNELWGNFAGDGVLTGISRIILSHLREIDIAARYGGEKYVILFPHTEIQAAHEIIERIRQSVASFAFLEQGLKITISAGMSYFPEQGDSPEQLLEHADQALFRAKASGRNQTVIWDREKDSMGERTDNLAGVVSGDLAKDYLHMQVLMETIQMVGSTADPEQQVDRLIEMVIEFTGSERALILAVEEEGFSVARARDNLGQDLSHVSDYSTPIAFKSLGSHGPIHEIWNPYGEEGGGTDVSVLCTPLKEKNEITGLLYVDSPDTRREIAETDITFFDTIAQQISMALIQVRISKDLKEKERAQFELNIAGKIQTDLLPQTFPEFDDYLVYGFTTAAKEVGGDYYDVIISEREYLHRFLAIGDVSGKGLPAGLVMGMAKSSLHTLIATHQMPTPAELLFHLNQSIYEHSTADKFMSFLLLEALSDGVQYASAGHEHIIVYRAANQTVESFVSGGVVLGLSPNIPPFEDQFLELAPGDFVLLYTDGVSEAMDVDEEQYGLERLLPQVEYCAEQEMDPKAMVDHLFADLQKFMGEAEQHDDITFLIVKKTA